MKRVLVAIEEVKAFIDNLDPSRDQLNKADEILAKLKHQVMEVSADFSKSYEQLNEKIQRVSEERDGFKRKFENLTIESTELETQLDNYADTNLKIINQRDEARDLVIRLSRFIGDKPDY